MSAIANAIDFVCDEFLATLYGAEKSDQSKNHSSTNQAGLRSMLYFTYAVMAYVVLYTHDVALIQWRMGWSFLCFSYFLGATFEFLGLFCLSVKVHANKSVAGISAQSLVLFLVSLTFRIVATTAYDGYLPVDKSGDAMVQLMGMGSIIATLYLLYCSLKKYVHTYQDEHDVMPVRVILSSCAICAFFIHGELNHNIFDQLWAFGLNVEVFQLLPQLYMMAKVGGVVDTATAHFVGNTFLSCLCRFTFWVWAVPGCKGLSSPEGYSWNMALGGIYIICAYILQTFIALDFVYYYVKAWWGGQKSVYLPKAGEEI